MKITPPCHGCTERHQNCHTDACEKWRIYEAAKAPERAERLENIKRDSIINQYRQESQRRFLKEKWRKEK